MLPRDRGEEPRYKGHWPTGWRGYSATDTARALPTSPFCSAAVRGGWLCTPAPIGMQLCSDGKEDRPRAQLSTAPETAINQRRCEVANCPASLPLRWNNPEACSLSAGSVQPPPAARASELAEWDRCDLSTDIVHVT